MSDRIAKVPTISKKTTFKEWKEMIDTNFPELSLASEIAMSTVVQMLINDITNPFALVLLDVPSSGKTITLNFFSDIEKITYTSDKFTPSAFVSNAVNVKKEKLKDIDLLPRLQYKTFIVRDLATIFSKREEDLQECLGILTRVLDGEGLQTDTGVHGQRKYNGDFLFMLLAASTPIIPRVWKIMGNLGSRLFFLNMNITDKSEKQLVSQLSSTAYKEREKICREKTQNFIYSLWNQFPEGINWDREKDRPDCKLIIARCAKLLAKLRGVINNWKEPDQGFKQCSYSMPVIEKPDRVNQLLYNLCRGHALICGRQQINHDDLRVIIKIIFDSVPIKRGQLFKKLLDNQGILKTIEVEQFLNCSKPTALREMRDLTLLGLCDVDRVHNGQVGEPQKIINLRKDFHWFLSDDFKSIDQWDQ